MNDKFQKELSTILNGDGVLTDPVQLYLYSYDAGLDKAMPGTVVIPSTTTQVLNIIRLANKYRIPYVSRGAGTNLCGSSIPTTGGLVICTSRLNRILSIDPNERCATVEPGVINLHLQNAAARHGLFYAPDPSSLKASTIGGNVATNAGGPKCLKYGVTSHHVTGLDAVMPDGETASFEVDDPGYDMAGLFLGAEGTLGVVTKIKVKLLSLPESTKTMLAIFPSIETAIASVSEIIAKGITPSALEAMDKTTIDAVEAHIHAGYPKAAGAVLLIEVDGRESELACQIESIRNICQCNSVIEFKVAANETERNKLWEGRRGAYPAMARLAPNVLVEDGAVPRNRLPEAVGRVKDIASYYKINMSLVFHAGDGNLHPQIIFDERNKEETKRVKEAGFEMLKAFIQLDGTITGEHGVGTDKLEAMNLMFDTETLALFGRIKKNFDPDNLCNPGKKIPVFREKEVRSQKSEVRSNGETTSIIEHDAGNFSITASGGTKISELKSFVESRGQFIHINGQGTLGEIIMTRSQEKPGLREQILGMRVRLGNGRIVKFGGKVMKNVAGYDAGKLLIDSRGTLGEILEVTLRLFPYNTDNFEFSQKNEPMPDTRYHQLIREAFNGHL